MPQRIITVATCFTMLRIFLVPFIVVSLYEQLWLQAGVLFACAAITDALDGAVARWRNEQTLFGACLDPVADKLLLIATFGALASVHGVQDVIPVWFVLLVVAKELVLVSSVIAIYLLHGTVNIRPTLLGKMTTVVQILLVITLVCSYFFCSTLGFWYQALLLVTTGMLVASYVQYAYEWYRSRGNQELV